MLIKKIRKKRGDYEAESENLAVPEIHTGEIKEEEKDDKTDKDEYITYDNVAIPEIHIKKKK